MMNEVPVCGEKIMSGWGDEECVCGSQSIKAHQHHCKKCGTKWSRAKYKHPIKHPVEEMAQVAPEEPPAEVPPL